jgi:hypothetical protein
MSLSFKSVAVVAIASVLALPVALGAGRADAASCHTRKFNGTLLGAAGGAVIGGALTHGATGPIAGGLAGAVVGREIGRSGCHRSYGRTSYYHRRTHHYARPARYDGPPARASGAVYYDERGEPVVVDRR